MMKFKIIPVGFRQRIILGFSCLIFIFLSIMMTVNLMGIPGTNLHGSFAHYRSIALNDMEIVSGLLNQRIADWFTGRRADVAHLSHSPMFRQAIAAKTQSADLDLSRELNAFVDNHTEFESVAIIDPQDASIRAAGGYFANALNSTDIYISHGDISMITIPGFKEKIDIRTPADQKNRLRIMRQVISVDKSDKIIAILVAEVNISNAMLPMALSVSHQFSRKYGVILAGNGGAMIVDSPDSLTDVSYQPDAIAAFNTFPPVRFALGGLEGSYDGPDQNGRSVLAFHRLVRFDQGVSLALVLTMNRMDAILPAYKFILNQIVLWMVMFVVGIVACFIIARQISNPLQDLVAVARRVESGDLTAKANTNTRSEIRLLAAVFNSMIARLNTWKQDLEQMVLDRTRELNESEKKYKMLVENLPQKIFYKDKELIYVACNENYAKDLNIEPNEIAGKTDYDYYPNELAEKYRTDDKKIIRSGRIEEIEEKYILNGQNRVVQTVKTPVLNDSGDVVGLLGIFWDVTEQRTLETQLQQAQKMESIGRLAGGVAHDFNNMLSIILGNTEMILDDLDSTNPVISNLQEIYKAAERSTNLTRQLLAFARKQTISPKVLDLNETIEGMLKMLRRLIGENIDLVWSPKINLWTIKFDPSQADQVLANLCVNARDSIKDVGKVTIETDNVSFDSDYCREHDGFKPGDYVMAAVSDNGCGMSKEILGNLFEPFFTTKGVGEGTGLGLATVYGIVKQNNGFINVYSEPDKGTTFRIYFPRNAEYILPKQKSESKEADARGCETILLVEDEEAILRMTTMMLERLGYTVFAVSNTTEAINIGKSHPEKINLLMTDVVMPGMNGRDLAKKMVELFPDLKCLFMSGYTANVIAHHGVLDSGMQFIQKPFSRQDLAKKLREVLDEEKGQVCD